MELLNFILFFGSLLVTFMVFVGTPCKFLFSQLVGIIGAYFYTRKKLTEDEITVIVSLNGSIFNAIIMVFVSAYVILALGEYTKNIEPIWTAIFYILGFCIYIYSYVFNTIRDNEDGKYMKEILIKVGAYVFIYVLFYYVPIKSINILATYLLNIFYYISDVPFLNIIFKILGALYIMSLLLVSYSVIRKNKMLGVKNV